MCRDEVDIVGAESYDSSVLATAYGDGIADILAIDYKARSDQQIFALNAWQSDKVWWETLKRVGYDPCADASPAKRRKL